MGRAVRPAVLRFSDDDRGAFMVLEAILVALLVLTAILFFTSLQRPTTGSDQGGLDLGQVSADTLQILQVRQFSGQTLEGWVTNAMRGDTTTATAVDQFIRQVLPTGARYSLRLDNGVSGLQILPSGSSELPRGARGAEILLVPNWATYRNNTAVGATTLFVTPGQTIASTDASYYPFVNPSSTIQCYQAPNSYSTAPDGADADTTADTWRSRWQSAIQTTTVTTNAKDNAATLGTGMQQVPRDLPLGKWRLNTNSDCTSGTTSYVNVVAPGMRTLTVSTTFGSNVATATGTTSDGRFSTADVGLAISGTDIPSGAIVTTVTDPTHVVLSAVRTVAGTSTTTVTLPLDPTYTMYGLQLVVWFGA
jgi:hypothetical protein